MNLRGGGWGKSGYWIPVAAKMREFLFASEPNKDLPIRGWVGDPKESDVFSTLRIPSSAHLAFSGTVENSVVVIIRIFDCIAGVIGVSESKDRYRNLNRFHEGFLIEIDTPSGLFEEWPYFPGILRRANWEKIMPPADAERMRNNMMRAYPDSNRRA
ncbi:MAG: hypothetical protein WDM89_22640 [Rhizomicrobium sp.]